MGLKKRAGFQGPWMLSHCLATGREAVAVVAAALWSQGARRTDYSWRLDDSCGQMREREACEPEDKPAVRLLLGQPSLTILLRLGLSSAPQPDLSR
ncbi:hypothetical protein E2C01_047878 [Portunus trituberculatus]|uniref:Uncharacterized protein n=1 Tax=Portunus trituberculatus TaxID=210409 RepID=A0A5B7G9P2_PORTR|nr:hypothetical protein [Portunus trituberculatus]